MRTVNECKLVGRGFEDRVAQVLSSHGFSVLQNLYVPYRPGSSTYAQVDIVAIRNGLPITVECKFVSGMIEGNRQDKVWQWTVGNNVYNIGNPLKQSYSHMTALRDNIGFEMLDLVVIKDDLVFRGPQTENVVRFSELSGFLETKFLGAPLPAESVGPVLAKLYAFRCASQEVVNEHSLYVNRMKNGDVVKKVENLIGVPAFCISVELPDSSWCFYSFDDEDGKHWGSEKFCEAALFDTDEEAMAVARTIPGAEVCTLSQGGVELLSDLPDELADLTPLEYADAVGARPW